MSGSDILSKIDALSEARTLPEAIRRMQEILNEMAYAYITGDGAATEAHELWRHNYKNALQDETRASAQPAARPPPHAHRPELERGMDRERVAVPVDRRNARRPQSAPAAGGDLPPSLRALYEGTHPSLREDD